MSLDKYGFEYDYTEDDEEGYEPSDEEKIQDILDSDYGPSQDDYLLYIKYLNEGYTIIRIGVDYDNLTLIKQLHEFAENNENFKILD